jgi:hypothetical protein
VEQATAYLEQSDHTAALWEYALEGDCLRVVGRHDPETRGEWRTADLERPLYLRLADLVALEGELAGDWRRGALAFANLYAPPVPTRRLALAKEVPLAWFAQEALLLHWATRLHAQVSAARGRARLEAARAALQLRHLAPELPEESVVHLPMAREETAAETIPASLPAAGVEQQLKRLISRHGHDGLWAVSLNVLASLLNLRLAGVTPLTTPGATRSGLPQLGLGFRFPNPRARIWYGVWGGLIGMKLTACERCHRSFLATRPGQRFCRKSCQVASGVDRHRQRVRVAE